MKKRLVSIIAVVVLVSVFATNVFAYPVSPNTYEMTTTPADDLTDVETVVYRAESETDYAYSPAICIT